MKKPLLSLRFDRALAYMMKLHRHQPRKGTKIPYISHLLAVAGIVLENGGKEDEAIAALLHDAIEDHPHDGQTRMAIRKQFGPKVLKIVEGCTDADTHPKPPWRKRKVEYIEHLKAASPSVLRVALADKTHNLKAILRDHSKIGPKVWKRFNAGPKQQVWYYRSILRILEKRFPGPATDQFADLILRLEKIVPLTPQRT